MDPKWWVLLAVGTGTFMSALDGSVVNLVLPVVTRAFATDVATIEWVVTTYPLVVSGLLLSFGRLGDLRGHKRVYGRRTGILAVNRLTIVAHDRFQEIIDDANRPDSIIRAGSSSAAIFPPRRRGRCLCRIDLLSGPAQG